MQEKNMAFFLKTLAHHREDFTENYNVNYVGIFGSYVRHEENTDSDLDVLVTFSKQPGLLRLVALENYFSDLLGVKVDLVMKDGLKPAIGQRIQNEVVEV